MRLCEIDFVKLSCFVLWFTTIAVCFWRLYFQSWKSDMLILWLTDPTFQEKWAESFWERLRGKKNSYSSSMRDLLCEKIEEGQGVSGCHISISAWRKYLSSFLVHSYMCYLSILFRKERHKERYAKILCCIRFTTTMLRVLYEKIYSNKTFSWGCVRQRLSCVMLKGFEEIAPVVCKVITHMCNSQSSIHCWFDLELPVTPRVLVGEVAGT